MYPFPTKLTGVDHPSLYTGFAPNCGCLEIGHHGQLPSSSQGQSGPNSPISLLSRLFPFEQLNKVEANWDFTSMCPSSWEQQCPQSVRWWPAQALGSTEAWLLAEEDQSWRGTVQLCLHHSTFDHSLLSPGVERWECLYTACRNISQYNYNYFGNCQLYLLLIKYKYKPYSEILP